MTIPPNTFKQYYNALNLADKIAFANKVRASLAISESTFYRRINMPWLFSPLERKEIAKIAEISEQVLFSEETLNQTA